MNRPLLYRILIPLLLVGAPLAGAWFGGLSQEQLLQFPPRKVFIHPAPFSWIAWCLYAVIICSLITPLLLRLFRAPRPSKPQASTGRGGAGLLLVGLSLVVLAWTLAWTRWEWFAPLQRHTFLPLWVGFIVTVSGLARLHRSPSPWHGHPDGWLHLFAASALFWWYFEFLNRFVQNWHYSGESYTPFQYAFLATLSFSTVLPAVVSLTVYLYHRPRLHRAFACWHALRPRRPRFLAWTVLALATASMALIGLFPDHLFALLWVSPLATMVSLAALTGRPHVLQGLARGDWRLVIAAAGAALICGFFWELWNLHSLARWHYAVPHVQAFHLFEMPLLGYAGYLPFGLECIQAVMLFGLWREPR